MRYSVCSHQKCISSLHGSLNAWSTALNLKLLIWFCCVIFSVSRLRAQFSSLQMHKQSWRLHRCMAAFPRLLSSPLGGYTQQSSQEFLNRTFSILNISLCQPSTLNQALYNNTFEILYFEVQIQYIQHSYISDDCLTVGQTNILFQDFLKISNVFVDKIELSKSFHPETLNAIANCCSRPQGHNYTPVMLLLQKQHKGKQKMIG